MKDGIKKNGNQIIAKGPVRHGDLRILCSTLHKTINEQKWPDVMLDFSMCDGVTEAVMLPLIPIIADYRKKGTGFQLIEPQDDKLRRLFLNANWAYYIDPDKYDRNPHEGGHVPALRFGDDETSAAGEILTKVMNLILGQLETERATLKAVEWALWEIMDNVVNHSQSPVGGFVQATAYKKTNRVEFVVADAGIAFPVA